MRIPGRLQTCNTIKSEIISAYSSINKNKLVIFSVSYNTNHNILHFIKHNNKYF